MSFLQLEALELLLLQVVMVHGVPDPLLLPNLTLILHQELSHVHVRQIRQRLYLLLCLLACSFHFKLSLYAPSDVKDLGDRPFLKGGGGGRGFQEGFRPDGGP